MKAKVLLAALPLPCVLCLGYICGIGVSGLGSRAYLALAGITFSWWLMLKQPFVALLLGCAIFFGVWQGAFAFHQAEQTLALGRKIEEQHDKKSLLRLEAVQGSERAGKKTVLVAKTVAGSSTLIRLEAREHFEVLPGDVFDVQGRFRTLEHDEESSFNYPIFLAKGGVAAVFQVEKVSLRRQGEASFQRSLAIIRRESLARIASLWPGDTGGLIAGILVGARGSFSEQLVESMRVTGLMHIVAVSGFNMTILINAVLSMTGFLQLKWRAMIAAGVLILFTLFVGLSGAVVRACLMGIIALIAKVYARPATAFSCLMYAGFCMLVFSPLDLLYDIGFQLSFLAVLGLLWAEPAMQKIVRRLPKYIAEQLSPTLAAILWTLPISIVYFGSISVIAPVANLFVPPSIPFLMLGGFVTFCLSWIPGLGFVVWITQMLVQLWTEVLLTISHWLAAIPSAAIPVTIETAWSIYLLAGCYLALLLLGYYSIPFKVDSS